MPKEQRKIIHIDMDAFFASVEQRDNTELQGKPIVVGSSGKRGVIAAASYEARKYGVYSAMPSVVARRKCPHLIFVSHRFDVYKHVSSQIREIFFQFTDLVEPLSLDEAFLDVTQNKYNFPSASLIAYEIKKRIKEVTNLTASAGVSYNKFLAKIASDYNKPDGFFLINPDAAVQFVENLNVEKFFGVGKVTAKKMHKLGIFTGADLKKLSLPETIKHFGKQGNYFFKIARAQDNRVVNPSRLRKSVGAERTFEEDLGEAFEVDKKIEEIAYIMFERCKKVNMFGNTLTLKVKYADFKQITRSKTIPDKFNTFNKVFKMAILLAQEIDFMYAQVRLIGVTASGLNNLPEGRHLQLTLNFKDWK